MKIKEQPFRHLLWKLEKRDMKLAYKIVLTLQRIITTLFISRYFVMDGEVWDRLYFEFTGVFINSSCNTKNTKVNRKGTLEISKRYFGRKRVIKYMYKYQDGITSLMTDEGLLGKNKPFTKRGLFKILIPTYIEGGLFAPYYKEENEIIVKEREEMRRDILLENGCKIQPCGRVIYPKNKK